MSRTRQSFADVLAVAITPVLITALVTSLVFFLITVFYQGGYSGRLHWIMAFFVVGAVGIARISIEQGREYAVLFALPLALVTGLAALRFVQFGDALASVSWILVLGLMALIWWCADRLTWDCTVLDQSADASGEGLLQTVGLDREAETSSEAPPAATSDRGVQVAGLWQRFLAARRRPHAPGVWVIYFSLAALPIFGFGQGFLQSQDLEGRRYVFQLLVVYISSALGLLLSSSFLGLRRYLRERQIEMPAPMAATWAVLGATLIIVLLLVCYLLPRRNPEYSLAHLPFFATSPDDLRTSPLALGRDGPKNPEQATRTVDRETESEQAAGGGRQRRGEEGSSGSGGRSGRSGSPSEGSAGGQPDSSGRGPPPRPPDDAGSGSRSTRRGNSAAEQQRQQQPSSSDGRSARGRGAGDAESQASGPPPPENRSSAVPEREPEGRARQEASRQTSQQAERTGGRSARRRRFSPPRAFTPSTVSLPGMISGVYWLAAFLVIAVLLWRFRREVARALREFLAGLRGWWAGPPAREAAGGSEAVLPVQPPPRPFSAYRDPFAAGIAQRYTAEELVKYSFEAFEAWSREQGCERHPEQTPLEFARTVALRQKRMADGAPRLAALYNRTAYGQSRLPPSTLAQLQGIWENMNGERGADS